MAQSSYPSDLIEVSSQRLDRADQRLMRNLFLQIIVVGISVYSLALDHTPLVMLANKNLGFEAKVDVLQAIIMLLLVYLFMRFGFLLNTFVSVRLVCNSLLNMHLAQGPTTDFGIKDDIEIMQRLFDTDNIVEVYVENDIKGSALSKKIWSISSVFTTVVLSVLIITNNVCIFLYVETLFDPHYKYYAMAGFGILLAPFFVGFYLSRIADIAPSIKVSAVVCPLTIVAIVLAFDIL